MGIRGNGVKALHDACAWPLDESGTRVARLLVTQRPVFFQRQTFLPVSIKFGYHLASCVAQGI